ncbi:alpha-(1,3)-fucosyltransferase 10-like [Lytechinus variegatus]|uniref:alpha-(1,3)-fucosyltransferase 10-like n=1 Tax=Lytechinus variegatus TaxID=7654 RepID=UPI001BB2192F|nr:alpha-(1,3)-fucosyltransferase 10-like [Lytechinus variegatus]
MKTILRWKAVKFILIAVIILFFVSLFCSLQMQALGWDEDIVYTGDGPFWQMEDVAYGGKQVNIDGTDEHDVNHVDAARLNVPHPIIIWWTPFTGQRGQVTKCGNNQCFFTIDRHFQHHPNTSAFMFYGTDFKPDDVPVPRKRQHEWALFHEESPKNNYILSHPECLTLFNHTATFKRVSDYPITTQYLKSIEDLESRKYLKTLEEKKQAGLAPVAYVQSDCNPPSDRDSYVKELMKHIRVDSYGACLHNKPLPQELTDPLTMFKSNFFEIMSKYKFTLAFENALCEDYVTEKLWRPLILGSVPVYRGSPTVRDWLPDNNSAVVVDDYRSPKELADHLKYLDGNDEAYKKLLNFKKVGVTNPHLLSVMKDREWGVNDYTQPNFIDGFECLVCNRLHENLKARREGKSETPHIASPDHYTCPRPVAFSPESYNSIQLYVELHDEHIKRAKALRQLIDAKANFTSEQYSALVYKYLTGERN